VDRILLPWVSNPSSLGVDVPLFTIKLETPISILLVAELCAVLFPRSLLHPSMVRLGSFSSPSVCKVHRCQLMPHLLVPVWVQFVLPKKMGFHPHYIPYRNLLIKLESAPWPLSEHSSSIVFSALCPTHPCLPPFLL
jgi:hypothetical protein